MNKLKLSLLKMSLCEESPGKLVSKLGLIEILVYSRPIAKQLTFRQQEVDLILSDIDMRKWTELPFSGLAHPPFVVFITGHYEYAVDGFRLDVIDYILKPLLTEERDQRQLKIKRQFCFLEGALGVKGD
jgi:DNA-binding LytR/AlgR family response regulator